MENQTRKFTLNPKEMQDNKINVIHVTEKSKEWTRHITVAYRWTKPDVETGDDTFRHVEYGATIWRAQNGQKAKMPYSRRANNHTAVERLKKHPVCVDLHFNRLTDEDGNYSAKQSIDAFENEIRHQLTKHGVRSKKPVVNQEEEILVV